MFYSYTITDVNGCSGLISGQTGTPITAWPAISVTGVDPSCTNIPMGAIHLQCTGPSPEPVFAHIQVFDAAGTWLPYSAYPDAGSFQADITGIGPGTYKIRWSLGVTLENLDPMCSWDTLTVVVPSLTTMCGDVQGISWYDSDGDCAQDAGEVGIPYSPLLIQPGNEVVHTNSIGRFYIPLYNGNYTLEQTDPYLVPLCPVVQPIPITVNSNTTALALANNSTQPLDLRALVNAGIARPGFDLAIHGAYRNLSPQVSGPVTVSLTLDPVITYVSALPVPTSVVGNTLTWQLPALTSYANGNVEVTANIPASTALGTQLVQAITISNTLPDADPSNDLDLATNIVTGSFDPNETHVRTSSGLSDTDYLLGTDTWVDYTIRFQNTGTDTAFTVVVVDTLPAELDLLRYVQGPASHPFVADFRGGGVVEWRFANILLPDSNTNEAASHGQVSFRIHPSQPLTAGTTITDRADIYFDFNTPVRTNDAVLTATLSTGIVETQAVPCRVVVAGDRLTLFATGASVPVRTLHLLTADGRLLRSTGTLTLDANGHTLDIGGLANGCYLLWLRTTEGRTWRERFVK
jgi:hypothetical protein